MGSEEIRKEEMNKTREVLPCSACQKFSLHTMESTTYLEVRHESANTLFITCANRLLALVKLPYYYCKSG